MKFFAVATQGLVDALETELVELGFETLDKTPSGVYFEASMKGAYKANLQSRIASRILWPLHEGRAREGEDLYHLMDEHDFTQYFDPSKTFKVEASVKECSIRDQRFVAMKVKDVIADQFRNRYQSRPNVDTENPQVQFFVKGYKDHFMISIDTSGEALFRRGYRMRQGLAPMKETLAAGLLHYSGWDPATEVLVDPMCGSGTILIEAAMKMAHLAPGGFRKSFGFQNLTNFNRQDWEKVASLGMADEIEIPATEPIRLFGYDVDSKAIQMAVENAKRAGVDHLIQFKKCSIAELTAPAPKGMIVTNPPYAARLGEMEDLSGLYKDFSHTLKKNFHGWSAWVLSGNKELIGDLKLKATRKHFVFNGAIECRFLKYDMFVGASEDRVYRSKAFNEANFSSNI